MVKKVAVIGPECTGKSDLSEFLANHYHTAWVPEYARGYLDNLVRPYEQHDLLTIAHGQMRLEDKYAKDCKDLMICDTNLYVIKVWSQFKFGNCHPEILHHIGTENMISTCSHTLICLGLLILNASILISGKNFMEFISMR